MTAIFFGKNPSFAAPTDSPCFFSYLGRRISAIASRVTEPLKLFLSSQIGQRSAYLGLALLFDRIGTVSALPCCDITLQSVCQVATQFFALAAAGSGEVVYALPDSCFKNDGKKELATLTQFAFLDNRMAEGNRELTSFGCNLFSLSATEHQYAKKSLAECFYSYRWQCALTELVQNIKNLVIKTIDGNLYLNVTKDVIANSPELFDEAACNTTVLQKAIIQSLPRLYRQSISFVLDRSAVIPGSGCLDADGQLLFHTTWPVCGHIIGGPLPGEIVILIGAIGGLAVAGLGFAAYTYYKER